MAGPQPASKPARKPAQGLGELEALLAGGAEPGEILLTGPAGGPRVVVTPLATPLGTMIGGASEDAVCLLEYTEPARLEGQLRRLGASHRCTLVAGSNALTERLGAELEAYFDGRLEDFAVPLATRGTPFQEAVWSRLREVPYGTTASYGELARRIGRPKAVRAVARANGDNRLAILVPCHRIVGSDGSLTGYGGGLWRKQRLLELEGARLDFGA